MYQLKSPSEVERCKTAINLNDEKEIVNARHQTAMLKFINHYNICLTSLDKLKKFKQIMVR